MWCFSCAQPCVGHGLTLGGRSHRPTRGLLTAGPSDQGWEPVRSWGSGCKAMTPMKPQGSRLALGLCLAFDAHLPALSSVGLCPWLLRQGKAWVA